MLMSLHTLAMKETTNCRLVAHRHIQQGGLLAHSKGKAVQHGPQQGQALAWGGARSCLEQRSLEIFCLLLCPYELISCLDLHEACRRLQTLVLSRHKLSVGSFDY